jgi:hypothetical protein
MYLIVMHFGKRGVIVMYPIHDAIIQILKHTKNMAILSVSGKNELIKQSSRPVATGQLLLCLSYSRCDMHLGLNNCGEGEG